jgi:hypothetical protein
VYPSTSVRTCLSMLLSEQISSLPVVDEDEHRVLECFSRFDAIGILVNELTDRLEMPVGDALRMTIDVRALVSCFSTSISIW